MTETQIHQSISHDHVSVPAARDGAIRKISETQLIRREERKAVQSYRDRFAVRVIVEFLISLSAWATLLYLGIAEIVPLWPLVLPLAVVATTFYMGMHEACHGNIWGAHRRARWGESLIGVVASIPLGFDFFAHRISHNHHHAFTNDAEKDPDFYTAGQLRELPITWLGSMLALTILPLLLLVPSSARLLPAKVRPSFAAPEEPDPALIEVGKSMLRYWLLSHGALVASFVFGFGWKALLLWFIPARIAPGWLQMIFAWYPHHPTRQGRYVDSRVATFRGSTWLMRGHDHHALHHLFPRVPHYYLPRIWKEIGPELVSKGVRAEGTALGSTGPIRL